MSSSRVQPVFPETRSAAAATLSSWALHLDDGEMVTELSSWASHLDGEEMATELALRRGAQRLQAALSTFSGEPTIEIAVIQACTAIFAAVRRGFSKLAPEHAAPLCRLVMGITADAPASCLEVALFFSEVCAASHLRGVVFTVGAFERVLAGWESCAMNSAAVAASAKCLSLLLEPSERPETEVLASTLRLIALIQRGFVEHTTSQAVATSLCVLLGAMSQHPGTVEDRGFADLQPRVLRALTEHCCSSPAGAAGAVAFMAACVHAGDVEVDVAALVAVAAATCSLHIVGDRHVATQFIKLCGGLLNTPPYATALFTGGCIDVLARAVEAHAADELMVHRAAAVLHTAASLDSETLVILSSPALPAIISAAYRLHAPFSSAVSAACRLGEALVTWRVGDAQKLYAAAPAILPLAVSVLRSPSSRYRAVQAAWRLLHAFCCVADARESLLDRDAAGAMLVSIRRLDGRVEAGSFLRPFCSAFARVPGGLSAIAAAAGAELAPHVVRRLIRGLPNAECEGGAHPCEREMMSALPQVAWIRRRHLVFASHRRRRHLPGAPWMAKSGALVVLAEACAT